MAFAPGTSLGAYEILTLLGSIDGRINFRGSSSVQLTTISAAPFDDMPDVSLPPGMVR